MPAWRALAVADTLSLPENCVHECPVCGKQFYCWLMSCLMPRETECEACFLVKLEQMGIVEVERLSGAWFVVATLASAGLMVGLFVWAVGR